MMKKRAISIVLVLLLLLSLALTGCGSKDAGGKEKDSEPTKVELADDEKIIGDWNMEMEMVDEINKEFEGNEMEEYLHLDTFPLTLTFTFKNDGTYACTVDQDAFTQAVEGVKTTFKDGMTRYAQDLIDAQGVDMSVDELFEMMNTSLDEMVDSAFDENTMSGITDVCNFAGQYSIGDGKLHITVEEDAEVSPDCYYTYTFKSDTSLSLESSVGYVGDDAFGDMLPLTLTKQG